MPRGLPSGDTAVAAAVGCGSGAQPRRGLGLGAARRGWRAAGCHAGAHRLGPAAGWPRRSSGAAGQDALCRRRRGHIRPRGPRGPADHRDAPEPAQQLHPRDAAGIAGRRGLRGAVRLRLPTHGLQDAREPGLCLREPREPKPGRLILGDIRGLQPVGGVQPKGLQRQLELPIPRPGCPHRALQEQPRDARGCAGRVQAHGLPGGPPRRLPAAHQEAQGAADAALP
mmetsp:Transcript_52215/g.167355  ORF Transcript_52215/g.167355 Transcript_52215/m.167355 type:complete len:226 (+) Transcript_52215:675-1352(+)